MLQHLQHQAIDTDPDSLISALRDWSEVAMYIGPRLSEWAQENGRDNNIANAAQYTADKQGTKLPRAFISQDISAFRGKTGQYLDPKTVFTNPDAIYSLKISWRIQKKATMGNQNSLYDTPMADSRQSPHSSASYSVSAASAALTTPLYHSAYTD